MKRVLTVILVTLLAVVMVSCAQQEVTPSETPAPSEPPELSESAEPSPEASTQPEQTAGMANPWKTVADADEAAALGMAPGHRDWFGLHLADGFRHAQGDSAWAVPRRDTWPQARRTWLPTCGCT